VPLEGNAYILEVKSIHAHDCFLRGETVPLAFNLQGGDYT